MDIVILIMIEATLILIGFMIFLLVKMTRTSDPMELKDNEKIEYNVNIISIINNTVRLEVTELIKQSEMLGEKYTSKNLEADVKLIATNVYEAFKKEIYINSNNVYTPEYLMLYISRQTTLQLFEYIHTNR